MSKVIRYRGWFKVNPWYEATKYVLATDYGRVVATIRKISGLWNATYEGPHGRSVIISYVTLWDAKNETQRKITSNE